MYMIREVMNCKPGKVKDLLGRFKAVSKVMGDMGLPTFRFYTDFSGQPFWTLVAEIEVDSLNFFIDTEAKIMSNEEARKAMTGYHDLVESGRREVYKVE